MRYTDQVKASIAKATSIKDLLDLTKGIVDKLEAEPSAINQAEIGEINDLCMTKVAEFQAEADDQMASIINRMLMVSSLDDIRKMNYEIINEGLLKAFDGFAVWMRDDYLSMRGYANGNEELSKFLEVVAEEKQKARANGVTFSA